MQIGDLRALALDIFSAAVDAVHPVQLMHEALELKGSLLQIRGLEGRGLELDLSDVNRVVAVGAGKATAPMTAALEELLGARLEGGVISVKYGYGCPLEQVEVREAGHPIPDEQGLAATREILDLLEGLGEGDVAFVLLSGGGSALLDAYPEGISLEEAGQTFDILLNSGAPIQEMNVVRKHISLVKGGQLGRMAFPARVISLVLSDVVGDPLHVIASGPTVPDPSTFREALEILDGREVTEQVPSCVRSHLEKGAAGEIPETPKEGDAGWDCCNTFLIGNIRHAIEAATERAEALGLQPHVLTMAMEGEARLVGQEMANTLAEAARSGQPVEPPFCLIAGGETTVTISGEAGVGGRSQELALSAAIALQGIDGVVLLAAGTDGTDGPTDAAGGIIDGGTIEKARQVGCEALDFMRRHDSYNFLRAAGGLIKTGPTMTNVMDIVLLAALSDVE